jgi:hypothetical protein
LIAGIGCIALGAYTALFWKDFQESWYLHAFRRKPGFLLETLDSAVEGTPARAALVSYAGTPEGQDALLRIAIGLHPEWIAALEEPGAEGCVIGVYPKAGSWYLCTWGGGRMRSILENLDARARTGDHPRTFQRLAELAGGSKAPRSLAEHPGIAFAFWQDDLGYKWSVERL